MKLSSLIGMFALAVLLGTSCVPSRVEVYTTSSQGLVQQEDQWVFENDTLMLLYSFWSSGGRMSFVIYNKSTRPLFINWKNSALILNDQKKQYWSDAVKFSSSSASTTSTRRTSVSGFDWAWVTRSISTSTMATVTSGAMVKDEMITSLPPRSYIGFQKYRLMNELIDVSGPLVETHTVNTVPGYKKKENVSKIRYPQESSPVRFRNFMQISFEEEMKSVFYVDNSFWLSEVQDMSKRHFQGTVSDRTPQGGRIYSFPYKKRLAFFRSYRGYNVAE